MLFERKLRICYKKYTLTNNPRSAVRVRPVAPKTEVIAKNDNLCFTIYNGSVYQNLLRYDLFLVLSAIVKSKLLFSPYPSGMFVFQTLIFTLQALPTAEPAALEAGTSALRL